MIEINSNSKVLIVNLGGIGDVLLSQLSVRALKTKYNCRVDMLIVRKAKELADSWDFIEKSHVFPINNPAKAFIKAKGLYKEKYDIAINMRTIHSKLSSLKIKILFKMIGAKNTAGRNTNGLAPYFDIEISEKPYGEIPEIEYCRKQMIKLGVQDFPQRIEWYFSESHYNKTNKIFEEGNFVIHPGAGTLNKIWPKERFVEIINYLLDKFKQKKIYLIGGSSEKIIASEIAESFDERVVDISCKTSLFDAAAIISKSCLFITNDNGIMHVAASLDVPMIAIFSSGDLKRFDPRYISENSFVIYNETDCAPCDKYGCRDLKCIKSIKTKTVISEIENYFKYKN